MTEPTRRDLLAGIASAALGAAAAGSGVAPTAAADAPAAPSPRPGVTPALFVGHGSPMTVLDAAKGAPWTRWTSSFGKPRAIVIVSAHWERAPATIGATTTVPLVYDYYGFPPEMYRVRYPAPGAPALAERVAGLLAPLGPVARNPSRGLDHGAFVPLRWMYPEADVPVLPLSLPTQEPSRLLALGRALAPLRREGVLVLGSGNLTHNLRTMTPPSAPPANWASEFDAWCAAALERKDLDALAQWQRRGPGARMAHPTAEHFTPILVVAGAGFEGGGAISFPLTGFEASISRRCVQVG